MYLWAMIVLLMGYLQKIKAVNVPNHGAEYLQSAIRDLQKKSTDTMTIIQKPMKKTWIDPKQTLRTTNRSPGSSNMKPSERFNKKQDIPELSLTKAELLSLYESAVTNGNTIKLDSQQNGVQLHAPYFEIMNGHQDSIAVGSDVNEDEHFAGYYYYYYPLNSFLDEHTLTTTSKDNKHNKDTQNSVVESTVHSHTHQHNVKIESSFVDLNHKNKGLEPLFMAISSFVGMAVMFVFSMVFLPKLTGNKSRRVEATKPNSQQIISLSTIVLKAIEGHDCSERVSCEIGKTLKALKLHDNRFMKLLQRIVPASFSRRIENIRKHAVQNQKCNLIQCKTEKSSAKVKNNKNVLLNN